MRSDISTLEIVVGSLIVFVVGIATVTIVRSCMKEIRGEATPPSGGPHKDGDGSDASGIATEIELLTPDEKDK